MPHGCKVAVVDATGKVLDTTVVYPTYGERQKNEAITKLAQLVKKHGVEHIAIGNGTASRETEQMTVELIHEVGGRSQLHDRERGGRVGLLRQQAGRGGISRSSTSTSAPPYPSPDDCRTRWRSW